MATSLEGLSVTGHKSRYQGHLLSEQTGYGGTPRTNNRSGHVRSGLSGLLTLLMFVDHYFREHIWQVAGRESGSPELLGSPRTSPEVPELPRKFFGDFPGSSLTVELNSNPHVPRKFPKLPWKSPKPPWKLLDFPGGQPISLGSLAPSPDSQKFSLIFIV